MSTGAERIRAIALALLVGCGGKWSRERDSARVPPSAALPTPARPAPSGASAGANDGGAIDAGGVAGRDGGSVSAITLDPENVYFIDGDGLKKCALTGCDNDPTVLVNGTLSHNEGVFSNARLALYSALLYFDDDGLSACSVNGLSAPRMFARVDVSSLAVSNGVVAGVNAADGSVFECPAAGASIPNVLWQGASFNPAQAVAVDSGGGVYFTTIDPPSVRYCAPHECPNDVKELLSPDDAKAAGVSMPADIVLVGDYLYFVDVDASVGGVYSCPKSGCGASPTVLFKEVNGLQLRGIVTDGSSVYWDEFEFPNPSQATSNGGNLLRCSIAGCALTPDLVASGLDPFFVFAVDDRNVYVSDNGSQWPGQDLVESAIHILPK